MTPKKVEMPRSCIILAGGRSVRLGHDKISEKLLNLSLLEHVVSHIESLVSEIIIVVAGERALPQLESSRKIQTVSDIYPGNGSLGGIHAGLSASSSFYSLVVAADMPFLNKSLLQYIFEISDGFDFVLPRIETFFEPLHAVYSKNCIEPAESIMKQGRKAIIGLFDFVKVRYVEVQEIDKFDPKHLSFFNINTKEDLKMAERLAAGAK
jgi:molybdopterin-guanine dinucleotide biosynthesis protein A